MKPNHFHKGKCCGTCRYHDNAYDYEVYCKKYNVDVDVSGCCADWENEIWSGV